MEYPVKKFNKKDYLIALFVILGVQFNAQVSEFIQDLEKKYPNENILTLLESKKYRIEMKNDKPSVHLEIYSERIIMNDLMASDQEGDVSFSKLRKLKVSKHGL